MTITGFIMMLPSSRPSFGFGGRLTVFPDRVSCGDCAAGIAGDTQGRIVASPAPVAITIIQEDHHARDQ